MHATKNTLSGNIRAKVIAILQQHLADTLDLGSQLKQAHWNVKGPSFIALHELFDKIAEENEEYVDMIAERIAQFGGKPEGTLRMAGKRTELKEYPANADSGEDHVAAVAKALAAYGDLARKAIDQTDELGDAGTADLFTQISRGIDKSLWFVEAHQQAES